MHVIPSTQTSQTEEGVRAKYNASRKLNSLPVVVIVETENTVPAGIVAPGQGIKRRPASAKTGNEPLEVGLINR